MRSPAFVMLCLGACRAAGATAESHAVLEGDATFHGARIPEPQRGTTRLVIRGHGELGDCPGEDQFVATYEGDLMIADDGSFTAPLHPEGVTTSSGCIVRSLTVRDLSEIAIDARVAATRVGCERACSDSACLEACVARASWIAGRGELTFQTLTAVDGDAIESGAFDELHATLWFDTPLDEDGRPVAR